MIRERVLTISTLLALVAMSGIANAQASITDKRYRQAEPDWYRARAMQPGPLPAQIVPEGYSVQQRCRFLGGPKAPPTC